VSVLLRQFKLLCESLGIFQKAHTFWLNKRRDSVREFLFAHVAAMLLACTLSWELKMADLSFTNEKMFLLTVQKANTWVT
jgi:hypothetical protein